MSDALIGADACWEPVTASEDFWSAVALVFLLTGDSFAVKKWHSLRRKMGKSSVDWAKSERLK